MIDLRYHLASIIGVFLALALGMLIGTQLAEDGAIAEEQARLAERIEADLDRIRAENRRLTTELSGLDARLAVEQQFVDVTLQALVSGALTDQHVAVYAPTADAPPASRVRAVLESAGAQVTVHARSAPPAADEIESPYVLLWSDEWGPLSSAEGVGAMPSGGVVAWPNRWTKTEAAMFAAGAMSAVEHVNSPHGLLALVEQLRSGESGPIDVDKLLSEAFTR